MIHSGRYALTRILWLKTTLIIEHYFIMGDDDLVAGGILPVGTIIADDDDPNTVESDDFLDDPEEIPVTDVPGVPGVLLDDDDDDLLGDE